jgi:hypothetical protein
MPDDARIDTPDAPADTSRIDTTRVDKTGIDTNRIDTAYIDTSVAHPARRYDYWLGGKDNFAADRESGDAIAALAPSVRIAAIENRRFLRRAVGHLAREAGIRQFLDIGTGIPTAHNTHQVAQAIAPSSRIVYVDNDPIVLNHARALLTSTPSGATAYLDADLRDPQKILRSAELRATIDLGEPVALMLLAILHFLKDTDDPYGVVRTLVEALPPGSYLALSHGTDDYMSEADKTRLVQAESTSPSPVRLRSKADIARFVDGMNLVPPGLAPVNAWRAQSEARPRPTDEEVSIYGVVARIP